MQAETIRELYQYHFAMNRRVWDEGVMALTIDQFVEKSEYSVGSVRNQCVHLFNIDERWFRGLRGEEVPGFENPVYYGKQRQKVRDKWDEVEALQRDYLAKLTDDRLPTLLDGALLTVGQVLLHVINHGTDHRAQLLRLLNELGVPTFPQDYAIWLMRRG